MRVKYYHVLFPLTRNMRFHVLPSLGMNKSWLLGDEAVCGAD